MFGLGKKKANGAGAGESADVKTYLMTIDGKPVDSAEHEVILNPANGEPVGRAPLASTTQVDEAVAAARRAFESWRNTSDEERREACRRISKVFFDNIPELSVLLTKEQGKPLKGTGSEFEIGGCGAWAGATAELDLPVKVIRDDAEGRVEQHRVPIGVVGSITPWNWPVIIAVWHVVPAIRAGNTVVLKPSPFTPLSTLRAVELIQEVLPAGVLNVVSGGAEIGGYMTEHPGIDKIVFTGSIATGKKVMASAAGNIKRLTLELGGNDAGVMLPGTDPKPFADGLFWGAFINGGQTCAAMKRLYVHDSDYDAVCQTLVETVAKYPVGDGMDENTAIGPLQNKMQFDKVTAMVEDAKAKGARILCGGEPGKTGYFYPLTIIADAKEGMRIVDEEQFGTVLPVIRYTDLDDAIARANGTEFGLSASAWGQDLEAAHKVAQRLVAGTVYVNKHGEVNPMIPFGGVKCSGMGVEFAEEGLEAYTDIKILNFAPTGAPAEAAAAEPETADA